MTELVLSPHLKAKEKFSKIAEDSRFSVEERDAAKLHLLVVNGIIELACKITSANPSMCYLNACDLIEEFIHDPLQEQS